MSLHGHCSLRAPARSSRLRFRPVLCVHAVSGHVCAPWDVFPARHCLCLVPPLLPSFTLTGRFPFTTCILSFLLLCTAPGRTHALSYDLAAVTKSFTTNPPARLVVISCNKTGTRARFSASLGALLMAVASEQSLPYLTGTQSSCVALPRPLRVRSLSLRLRVCTLCACQRRWESVL